MGALPARAPKVLIDDPKVKPKSTKPTKSSKKSLAPSKKKEWRHRSMLGSNDGPRKLRKGPRKSSDKSKKKSHAHK